MAKILLVEPDILLAKTYGQALLRDGHDARWCTTADQAILAADDMTPDLIVLEPQLAAHGGVEFLYEFRSYPEWDLIPVYLFSRLPVADFALSKEMMSNLGVHGYWLKTRMSLTLFLRAVNEVIAPALPGKAA